MRKPLAPVLFGTMILLAGLLFFSGCGSGSEPSTAENSGIQHNAGKSKVATGVASMSLIRLDSSRFESSRLNRDSATVLFILSPECPLCLDYAYTFRTLQEEYGARGFRFVGVFPGNFFSESEIRKYCSRFQLDFPMVLDPEYQLIHDLGAGTTPEALLLDENGQIFYQGSIDNWAYEVGQKRLKPTEHYLRDALQAMEKGLSPPVARTKPVGCLIE